MQAERVDVIAGRKALYFRKSRVFQMAGQNHVPNDTLSSQTDSREAHSYLKRNPCFLRNNTHGTARSHQSRKCPKQGSRVWSLSNEMLLQRIARAGMRLIPVGKRPPALRAFPEHCAPHGKSIRGKTFNVRPNHVSRTDLPNNS